MATYNEIKRVNNLFGETARERYQRITAQENERKSRQKNFFQKIGDGIEEIGKGVGYVGESLGLGIARGLEGVTDFVVGGIADLSGNDAYADRVLKNDWFNYNHANEWYNPNGTMRFIGDVASGVGNMLPAVAVAWIPGIGQAAASAIGTTLFTTSAMGQSTSEATKQLGTANGKAWGYGVVSGGLEAGIEKLSGGIGGSSAGKVLGKQLTKSALGKVAVSAGGEALEEAATAIIDPYLKKGFGLSDSAKVDWKEVGKSAALGAATGAVMSTASNKINAVKAGGKTNLQAMEGTAQLEERLSDNNLRQMDGKKAIYNDSDILESKQTISKALMKMTEENRSAYLSEHKNIAPLFNEDGSIKTSSANTQGYNSSAYSASLRGRESEFAYKPVSNSATIEAKSAMNGVTRLTKGRVNVVLTDEAITAADGTVANGAMVDGVLYLNAKADDFARANFVASHELTHTLEGTKEYNKLNDFIREEIKRSPELASKYNLDNYLLTYANAHEKEYGLKTRAYEAQTEMIADFVANEVLSKPDVVNRIAAQDSNIVVKFLNWIKDTIKTLGQSKEDRAAYRTLQKAATIFSNALKNARGGYTLDEVEEMFQKAQTEEENAKVVKFEQEARADKKAGKTSDARFSLKYADAIANNEKTYFEKHKNAVGFKESVLDNAISEVKEMVGIMSKYQDYLPQDKVGKVLKKNGSYGKTVENTTICVRTLAYNAFCEEVQKQIGRPLTQKESFLVSQKLYDIAVDPQCLYCYVSLDRKAYNDFLLRYIKERDEAMDLWSKSDKSKKTKAELFEKYRRKRDATDKLKGRFEMFLEMSDKGIPPLTASDIATKAQQTEIAKQGGQRAIQWKDMAGYAQSASWAKIQEEYVAYFDDILKMSAAEVKKLNANYGLRFYSFSDYTAAFIVENMQQVTDASLRGLKGLGYTKDVDFARIFAPTGMNINISLYARKNAKTGQIEIDPRQSANWEEAIKLREQYPNVGIVITATTDEAVNWALEQKWSDIVIPFHIVRTGADVAEFYKWNNYTSESSDRVGKTEAEEARWANYDQGKKKAKNILPPEHNNDKATYLRLCEERGLTPRFNRYRSNPNYMKLVNETRLSEKETKAMQPIFDLEAAKKSFDAFVGKGGYFKGWYKEGVNISDEVKVVAEDVKAGRKASEVEYGRQDLTEGKIDEMTKMRKKVRTHANARFSLDFDTVASLEEWFESLTLEELEELVGDSDSVETIESLPSKQERRDAYTNKLYENGTLNKIVTKVVKANPQMRKYFANTQMNNKYNPLFASKGDEYIVMFHGTPEDFNVFDTKRIGKHGTVMGSGIYFTESLRYAEDYKTDDGRVMATLLNIEKPLSRNKLTMSKEDLKRFIREVVDTDGDDFLSNYGDVYSLGYEKLLDKAVDKLYDYHTNDADLIEDIYITSRMDFDEFHDGLTDLLGYDGIIAWNKSEGTQAVTFKSNQAKDIFNFKPTKSNDVRYSIHTPRDISTVTKEEYEHHYWASANNILLREEFGALESAIGAIKKGESFGRNSDGLYMIPVGKNGIKNKIVFTDGEYESYSIEKVIEIDLDNETDLSIERRNIYASERRGIRTETNGITNVYVPKAYGFSAFQGKLAQNLHNSNGERDGRGNSTKVRRGKDADYLAAIEHGYLKLAQRLVDEAAKDAGYTIKAYHGSREIFNQFDESKRGSNTKTESSKRWFFAADQKTANSYYPYGMMEEIYKQHPEWAWANPNQIPQDKRGKLYPLYLKFNNPLTVDVADYDYSKHREKADAWVEFIEQAEANGNDGIILLNAMDNQLNTSARESTVYMFKEPSQAKSAETVTYDDNGNVIPLSKRFNAKNKDIRFSLPTANVKSVKDQENFSFKEKVAEVKAKTASKWLQSQIESTNEQAGIEHVGKALGVKNIEALVQGARVSYAAAQNNATYAQFDFNGNKVGESLKAIFDPVLKHKGKDYAKDFNLYLAHWRNVDSMSIERRAKAQMEAIKRNDYEVRKILDDKTISEEERVKRLKKTDNGLKYLALMERENKPVFNAPNDPDTIGEKESRSEIARLNTLHPEFASIAEKVWKYNKNLLKYRVDAGLTTADTESLLNDMYPHYVPVFREGAYSTTTGARIGQGNASVRETIKRAKGSNLDIRDIMVSMSEQTLSVHRAVAINRIAEALYDGAMKNPTNGDILPTEVKKVAQADPDFDFDMIKDNSVSFFKNGERVTMAVSKPVYQGFEGFKSRGESLPVTRVIEKANEWFKKAVTSGNPLFLVANAIRDFQEALVYTKNGSLKFAVSIGKAINEMRKGEKSKIWTLFMSTGAHGAGLFSREKGVYDSRGKVKKAFDALPDAIEKANNFVELVPRFTEFMLTYERTGDLDQALLDSAEVTTNFSRGGRAVKALNRTIMPFLNASVQGFSKLWRTAVGRKSFRAWCALIAKSIALGLAAGLVNDLINGDDEEYQKLSQREKDNNYIIKVDGVFLKIPKGRVISALGVTVDRAKKIMQGEDVSVKDYIAVIGEAVTPVQNLRQSIFTPIADMTANKTWYGGEIESARFENVKPSERYDETTSSIAIALGKIFNYSPKKIHYLIDQYTGVWGDIILPPTTLKAERNPVASRFTIDPVTSNTISTDFYDLKQELTYAKTAGDPSSLIGLRYMTKVASDVSDMYEQKRIIQNSNLSDKQKTAQTRDVQKIINGVQEDAMAQAELIEQALIDTNYDKKAVSFLTAIEKYDDSYKETATRKFTDYYYEYATAKASGKKVSAKYSLYEDIGVDKTAIYLTDISLIESDKDKDGNTIANSRRKKVLEYIEGLRISANQKYMILLLSGYALSDSGKQKLTTYLRGKGYSKEEIEELFD